jgi:hypothetical protein
MPERSIVRENLMTRPGYMPYCGEDRCFRRVRFDGNQFFCTCGWRSSYEPEFIDEYKARWDRSDQPPALEP